jgi:hypothetical protein
MVTPVAAMSESTCCGSGPSPTMPIKVFIDVTAGRSSSDGRSPKNVRSAATFSTRDILRVIAAKGLTLHVYSFSAVNSRKFLECVDVQ